MSDSCMIKNGVIESHVYEELIIGILSVTDNAIFHTMLLFHEITLSFAF